MSRSLLPLHELNALAAGRHARSVRACSACTRSGRAGRAWSSARSVPGRARSRSSIRPSGEVTPMARVHDDGVFEAHLRRAVDGRVRLSPAGHRPRRPRRPGRRSLSLRLRLRRARRPPVARRAPTSAPTRPSGARPFRLGAADGVQFAVWAPNAQRVSVVGDFNGWDPRVHPMRLLADAGRLGDLHPRARARPALQVRPARRPRPPRPQGRSVRAAGPRRRPTPPRSSGATATNGATPRGWRAATPRRRSAPPRCRCTRCTSDRGAAPTTAGGP